MFHPRHNIMYCPVDLPRYESEGEIERNFETQVEVGFSTQDRLTDSYMDDGLPYETPREWLPEARDKFPRLISFIEEHLPFETVCFAKIFRSKNNLGFHVDIGKFDQVGKSFYDHLYRASPAGYRIVLGGQYENVLHYQPYSGTPREKWVPSHLPKETNVFVHSSVDAVHGALYDPLVKRYTLFIHGWLDLKRHHELIERSYQKYQEHSLTYTDLIKAAK